MKFFFDRNISPHIARMIAHFDRENIVVHQDDDNRFSPEDEDVYLINTVRNDNPHTVWVTADISQKKNVEERAALRDSGMSIVFFKRFHKGRDFHYQCMKVLAVWPEIRRLCVTAKQPTVFEVPSGAFTSKKVDTLGFVSSVL